MSAIDVLVREHRVIERVLDALEMMTSRLERGAAVRPAFFEDAARFLARFADGIHHHKEEGVLFPMLVAGGLPVHQGPIPVMLEEHEQGRALLRGIRSAVHRWTEGDEAAIRNLASRARSYVALLRDHIAKEDEVLFPMAEDLLSPDAAADALAQFQRVGQSEAGGESPAEWLALADRLVSEAAGDSASGEAERVGEWNA